MVFSWLSKTKNKSNLQLKSNLKYANGHPLRFSHFIGGFAYEDYNSVYGRIPFFNEDEVLKIRIERVNSKAIFSFNDYPGNYVTVEFKLLEDVLQHRLLANPKVAAKIWLSDLNCKFNFEEIVERY